MGEPKITVGDDIEVVDASFSWASAWALLQVFGFGSFVRYCWRHL